MTPEQIIELQERWGRVCQLGILDTIFTLRPITRKEYKQVCSLDIDDATAEELICKMCVVSPAQYDFENCSAGIPTVLSAAVISMSCLDNDAIRSKLDDYRVAIDNFDAQVDLVIFEGFRGQYSLEEIRSWPVEKCIAMYAQAEWILKTLRGAPIELEDTNVG